MYTIKCFQKAHIKEIHLIQLLPSLARYLQILILVCLSLGQNSDSDVNFPTCDVKRFAIYMGDT